MNPSDKTQKTGLRILVMSVAGMLCGVACDPLTESERRYFETRDMDPAHQQAIMQTEFEWNSVDGAIELVKTTPAPDEENQTYEEWIRRMRNAIEGDVMFPRWEGRRLGSHHFEVRYTHTVIDYDYNIERLGYAWKVDTVLKTIEGPTLLDAEDLAPRPRRDTFRQPIPELLDEGFDPE